MKLKEERTPRVVHNFILFFYEREEWERERETERKRERESYRDVKKGTSNEWV